MKARDIIPGWPRPKQTSVPYAPIAPWWFGTFAYRIPDDYVNMACQYQHEQEANRRYHEEQQQMVDRWRREQVKLPEVRFHVMVTREQLEAISAGSFGMEGI